MQLLKKRVVADNRLEKCEKSDRKFLDAVKCHIEKERLIGNGRICDSVLSL